MEVSEKMYKLGTKRSAIRELFEFGKRKAAEIGKENVYDFSIGNPSIPAPDCVNEEIKRILTEEDPVAVHGYTSAQGDEATRKAIADYLNKKYETEFTPDNFYMTCGAAASLTIVFHSIVCSNEDEIMTAAPFFPEYKVFVEGTGAKLVVVDADKKNFEIDLKKSEELINEHTKAFIINSPNNPSGVVYSEDTIKALAELLDRKQKEYDHTIYLVTDEPYREIVYDGVEVPFVTKYYANTIVTYSYSKSLSLPGERIGWILVPDEVKDSKAVYAAVCGAGRTLGYVCAPSLMQKMLVKCVGQTGDVNEYKKNRDLLYNELKEIGYNLRKPEGAFYMFMEAPNGDSDEFSKRAMTENLLLVDADSFGCPGYVRISYCVDHDMIKRSLPAFKRLYDSYR
ncbi:MAG: pyridoxal phosphate-dependent aminotransferase [Lachnospiraceae bacterium]|nr:pyridoxal phosphate-dependent aminotransferase [Lachnospiraceae bacterium]